MTTSDPDTMTPHVVPSDETLDASWVLNEVTDTLTDLGDWISDAQEHERTALSVWDGQSADGRKHREQYGKKVFPFEGAADSRVHLTGQAVDELTMLEMMAIDSAKVQVIAMEFNDAAASKKVETLMKYETKQRLRSELWRESNFARQIKHTWGHAVIHVGWEQQMGTARVEMTLDDVSAQIAQRLTAEMLQQMQAEGMQDVELTPEQQMEIADAADARVTAMIENQERDALAELVRERHPLLSLARSRRVARDLMGKEMAEFGAPFRKPGRPCIKALLPGFEVFYPWWSHAVEKAPWVARVETLSEPELRAKVTSEGWNEAAVQAMMDMGPTAVIDAGAVLQAIGEVSHRIMNEPARLSFTERLASRQRRNYEVLYITVNTVDEDGYPATQEVICHPALVSKEKREKGEELLFLNRLVDYYFEGGCYVGLRREFKSRPMWESRGVSELAGTHQWLLKSNRDASMDRTSMATMPIVKVSARRMGAGKGERWDYEPGSRLPVGPGDDVDYLRPPPLDQGTILDSKEIRSDAANLLGLHNADLPPAKVQMHQQWIVTNALLEHREVLLRILGMDQQYMSPLSVSRVLGNGPLPYQVTRDEIAGSYDFVLEFDVKSLDMEYLQKRWSALKDAFSIPGVAGQLPTVPVVSWLLNNIDPGLSDMVTGTMQERSGEQAEQEKAAISMMLNGIEPNVTEDMDAMVRLQTDQEQMQNNPVVAQAYAQGGLFAELLNARVAAWQQQIQQRTENAQTGRTGFKPVMAA